MKINNFLLIIFVSTILVFVSLFAKTKMEKIKVLSSAFEHNGIIPAKYTCDGENISPDLKWENYPQNTKSFVIIADDPDAPMGTWVHWVVYNIPAKITHLKEAFPKKEVFENITQGITDFRKIGYGGPCPPSGTHRYFFKIYALDIDLNEKPGLTKDKILKIIEGHIIGYGELIGKYKRQK